MKCYKIKMESLPGSPYSQGRFHNTPKEEKELADTYEKRTWRERMHVDQEGLIFIPPMVLKNCLSEAAKFLSKQIPGKGKQTYTKHFEAGIMVIDRISLGVKKENVKGKWVFVPSDGRRGGSKRVMKCFPEIPEWKGEAEIHVIDDTITQNVLEEHLKAAGFFIGFGVFRPRNNGINGRFRVTSIEQTNNVI